MSTYEHSDDFEYRGIWWLPEDPERQVPGTLTVNGEGINLQLFGLLGEPSHPGGGNTQPDFILGRVRAVGGLITLYKAFKTRSTVPSGSTKPSSYTEPPRLHHSSYSALYMFLGAHFSSESEMRFPSLWVSFTHLEEWMGVEHIPFDTDTNFEDSTETARYSSPEIIETEVQEIDSKIALFSQLSKGGDTFRTLRWQHEEFVRIQPTEQQDFEWYQSVLRTCQFLFALFIGRPIHPRRLEARLDESTMPAASYSVLRPIVQIYTWPYVRSIRQGPQPGLHLWHWRNVLVPLPDIEANLEQIFNTWFEKEKLLRPVYELYFGTLYNYHTYDETEFLTLTQALESFHSRTSLNKADRYLPNAEYAKVQEDMMAALPKDIVESLNLEERLPYLNRYTLRTRLDELFQRVGHLIKPYLSDSPSKFTRRVTDTRNYLTHYGQRRKAYSEEELYPVNKKLRLWVLALLLLELDLDPDLVVEAASEFRKLHFVVED